MKRLSVFLNVLLFLLMGCSSTGTSPLPLRKYEGARQSFFKDLANNYKLAYQNEPFNRRPHMNTAKRIDIILSNFDGSDKKNITESLRPGEEIRFIYPTWSPDGEWLAFAGVKYLIEREIIGG